MIMPPLVNLLGACSLWVKSVICCFWESCFPILSTNVLASLGRNFFMWAVLYRKLIVSSLNFSETFSRVTINFSYVEDKLHSRQPSCNKWYHLKMWSYDCHILNCTILCWVGSCTNRVDVDACVCNISGCSRKAVTLCSESSFKSSSCYIAMAVGSCNILQLQLPGWSAGVFLFFNSSGFLC